ncbi:hypothetical protein UAY_01017 [Enterococcus moraviensis ATCC BAA-383]|uniref:Uncharacterized protein n=1 Tax=Enterococcus moraviensis ATCC BAA-383 TaxID=1158609 RepID=R2R1Y8_9ENTE|nr:hypothetical protein [Enterococcus moraviensis]EOI01611.1 hypothetical protein UAY_01017 [Enterococcus moraviensis ATCC BAA-383]EOT73854.1 hypothetical protein I586_00850 [Enterococcus moraviensis ATCC BAA-383]OJG64753.1 hypothetical protein RV09_GL001415 [Enterococcus moraviensis]
MKNRGRTMKVISRFFIAFLSSVFLFAFLILLTLRLTLFSENYIAKQAAKANYYSELTEEINRQIENSALGSNIPQGVLNESIKKELVEKDVNAYFNAMYNTGAKYSISNEKGIHDDVSKAITDYMKEKNIEVTPESEQAVVGLSDNAVNIYKGYIELPFLVSYGRKVMNYKSKLVIFMIVCGVLWALLSFFLYSSLRGYFHRLLRYWAYICIGSGLMMVVVPTLIIMQGFLKKLGIQSKAMYDFIQNYLSSFLWLFIIVGMVSIAAGIIFAVLSEVKRKQLFSTE